MEGQGPGKPLGVRHSTGLGSWETDSNLPRAPGVITSFPWASVSPSIKEGNNARCPPGTKSPGDLSITGDLSLPHSGCSPSLPQAPLLPNLSLVLEPQAPPSSGYLACLPEHPAPHAPAEFLGSTVKTPGFGISV